ncbi:MAG: hypothetical protein AB1641_30885 [Thermodesulfobacteriota bacterium]
MEEDELLWEMKNALAGLYEFVSGHLRPGESHIEMETEEDNDLYQKLGKPLIDAAFSINSLLIMEENRLEIEVLDETTSSRLRDPLLYEALEFAKGLHDKHLREVKQLPLGRRRPSLEQEVYPILGNTIQVIFEYLNQRIGREELEIFHKRLTREAENFIENRKSNWPGYPDWAFFTPSSYKDRSGLMPVLTDLQVIFSKYAFLKRRGNRLKSKS